jgi:hypothetical protein
MHGEDAGARNPIVAIPSIVGFLRGAAGTTCIKAINHMRPFQQ